MPRSIVARCQGEGDFATAVMFHNSIRGLEMVILEFISGPRYDDRRRGRNMVRLGVKQYPQSGSLSSSQTLQTAMHVCSACRCICQI